MAESAGAILERGHILVEIHDLAQQDVCPLSGVGQYWRLPCESWRRQGPQLRQRFAFDEINFTQNPSYLGIQIGRENPERVRVIRRRYLVGLISPSFSFILRGYEHDLR